MFDLVNSDKHNFKLSIAFATGISRKSTYLDQIKLNMNWKNVPAFRKKKN